MSAGHCDALEAYSLMALTFRTGEADDFFTAQYSELAKAQRKKRPHLARLNVPGRVGGGRSSQHAERASAAQAKRRKTTDELRELWGEPAAAPAARVRDRSALAQQSPNMQTE